MLTMTALASWEDAVLASVRGASGTIDEQDSQIRRSGMYAEYPAILRSYLDHIAQQTDAAEALKRAVFLVWISAVEPSPSTGIAELPERYAREAMLALEREAQHDRLDDELRAMLAWYHSRLAAPFDLFGADRHTAAVASDINPYTWRTSFTPAQFAHRGQLGHYWRSILASSPTH